LTGGELAGLVRSTLERNWAEGERDGVRYAYTRPSPSRYPWQWYWDSCFAAISWRRFESERSRAELESLLGAARADGFIGHTIFWEHPVSLSRSVYYNVASRSAAMTSTIQPPLLAWAWRIAVGDPAGEPRIRRHHGWLAEHRNLEGDGLLWIVQPDESGLDDSPKFDQVWGWRAHARLGFPGLIRRNRRLRWDARAIRDEGGPVVCEVMTNVLWGLARLAAGEPSITPVLVERLWDDEHGLFLDEVQPGGQRPLVETCAALAPLALPPRTYARAVAPLLARPDLDELRLADLARPEAAGVLRGSRAHGRGSDGHRHPRGLAGVLRPAHRCRARRDGLLLDEPGDGDGRPGPRVNQQSRLATNDGTEGAAPAMLKPSRRWLSIPRPAGQPCP
jgi:hypothetical protein